MPLDASKPGAASCCWSGRASLRYAPDSGPAGGASVTCLPRSSSPGWRSMRARRVAIPGTALSAYCARRSAALFGSGDDRHWDVGFAADAVWQIHSEPAGDAGWQCGEDDLVELPVRDRSLDRDHRVRVADGAVSRRTSSRSRLSSPSRLDLATAMPSSRISAGVGSTVGSRGKAPMSPPKSVVRCVVGVAGARTQNSAGPRAIRSWMTSSSFWPPRV